MLIILSFFVNYTNSSSGEAINGSGVYCEWRHNKTGTWRDVVNMSFDSSTGLYELIADGGYLVGHRDGMPYGNYSWNVSCYNNLGYVNLTVADEIEISLYSTALAIENGTDSPNVDDEVWFYANYTSPSMKSGVGFNRKEIGQVVWNVSFADNVRSIVFFDCENKGKKDCIAVGEDGNVFMYHSNGSLLKQATEPVASTSSIRTFDADNDGFENEIVVVSWSDAFYVYNETGDTVFDSKNDGGFTCTNPVKVEIGDFDGDNLKNDIVVSCDEYIMVWNTSNGKTWEYLWNVSVLVSEIHVSDLDKDGIDDIVVCENTNTKLYTFVGNNGISIFSTTDLGSGGYSCLPIDLNHDGYKDEVLMAENGDVYGFRFNGTYGAIYDENNNITHTSNPAYFMYEMSSADLDGNGWEDDYFVADIGLTGTNGAHIRGYDNNSDILSLDFNPKSSGPNYILSMSIGDLNSDGQSDIAFSELDYGVFYVINRTGGLLFEYNLNSGNVGSTGGNQEATDISDINNDGINDIAVASENGYAHVLQDVNCIACFNDSTNYNMIWNGAANKWQVNKSFSSAQTYSYNITCEKGGYETQISMSSIIVLADTTAPNVTYISDSPDLQGLGENVTITATVTDNVEVQTVLVGITPPGGSEVNYTIINQSSVYTYNYLNYINGIYNYTIYANDSLGNLNDSSTGTFEIYSDVYMHVKTLKDSYGANEVVNITDPFEFDLSGVVGMSVGSVLAEDVDETEDVSIGSVKVQASSISSVSGTVADGENVVISGSNFGVNSLDIEWLGGADGNIEQGTDGVGFSKTKWITDPTSGYFTTPAYSDTKAHSGNKSVKSSYPDISDFGSGFSYDYGSEFGTIYATWWVYFDHVDSQGQWKMWRLRPGTGWSNVDGEIYVNKLYNTDGSHRGGEG